MDFTENERARALRAKFEGFGRLAVFPTVAERDRSGRFDWDLLKQVIALSSQGSSDGPNSSISQLALALEALAAGSEDVGLCYLWLFHAALCTGPLETAGGNLTASYLSRLRTGEWVGTCCFPEGGILTGGSSRTLLAARSEPGWRLNGRSAPLVGGEPSDLFLVIATAVRNDGTDPILFLLERGTPGMKVEPLGSSATYLRGAALATVVFDNCALTPEAALPLAPLQAWSLVKRLARLEQVLVSAVWVGVQQALFRRAFATGQVGVRFGRPAKLFGDVQTSVAKLLEHYELSRRMVGRAAAELDAPVRSTLPAGAATAALQVLLSTQSALTDAQMLTVGSGSEGASAFARLQRDALALSFLSGGATVLHGLIAQELCASPSDRGTP